jgi:raffinose/stachyose/melibiose transport system substrate-binding protein
MQIMLDNWYWFGIIRGNRGGFAMTTTSTETRHPEAQGLQDRPAEAVLARLLAGQRAAAGAVEAAIPAIAQAAEAAAEAVAGGGRLAYAGAGSSGLMAPGCHADHRKLAQRRPDDLAGHHHSRLRGAEPRHQGGLRALGPGGIQRRAELQARGRLGRRPDHLPPVRRLAGLYNKGNLADLSGLPAWRTSRRSRNRAWQTDDGSGHLLRADGLGDPRLHLQQADAFEALGIAVPTTDEEFFAALDKIKADGTYIPMAMGTNDQWEAATMGYNNIGPNYWKGEEGRLAPDQGRAEADRSEGWVRPLRRTGQVEGLSGRRVRGETYPDSQNLFTLGRAAIYPAGSWEISGFNTAGDFKMGAFPPPVAAARRHLLHQRPHRHRLGMNAASPNAEAAQGVPRMGRLARIRHALRERAARLLLLNSTPVAMEDPLAQEFVVWRDKCQSTIRSTYQILSRGTPNLENETWNASANVIKGTETPEAAAERLQAGLASWYAPQQ